MNRAPLASKNKGRKRSRCLCSLRYFVMWVPGVWYGGFFYAPIWCSRYLRLYFLLESGGGRAIKILDHV